MNRPAPPTGCAGLAQPLAEISARLPGFPPSRAVLVWSCYLQKENKAVGNVVLSAEGDSIVLLLYMISNRRVARLLEHFCASRWLSGGAKGVATAPRSAGRCDRLGQDSARAGAG